VIGILKSFDHTRIITSHDLDMVLEVCDRVIVLGDGQLKADGPAKTIMTDDALLHASGLERPLSMQNCPVCGSSKGG
jgi:cobalt/nickel transport system ATP-binding protein